MHILIDNETSLFCPKNYTGQVMWQPTSGGHFDIQNCPTEQGGESAFFCLFWIDVGLDKVTGFLECARI